MLKTIYEDLIADESTITRCRVFEKFMACAKAKRFDISDINIPDMHTVHFFKSVNGESGYSYSVLLPKFHIQLPTSADTQTHMPMHFEIFHNNYIVSIDMDCIPNAKTHKLPAITFTKEEFPNCLESDYKMVKTITEDDIFANADNSNLDICIDKAGAKLWDAFEAFIFEEFMYR